jgi:hypothetical protein
MQKRLELLHAASTFALDARVGGAAYLLVQHGDYDYMPANPDDR